MSNWIYSIDFRKGNIKNDQRLANNSKNNKIGIIRYILKCKHLENKSIMSMFDGTFFNRLRECHRIIHLSLRKCLAKFS